MKVKELMEILAQYDEEREIRISLDEGVFDIEQIVDDEREGLYID